MSSEGNKRGLDLEDAEEVGHESQSGGMVSTLGLSRALDPARLTKHQGHTIVFSKRLRLSSKESTKGDDNASCKPTDCIVALEAPV